MDTATENRNAERTQLDKQIEQLSNQIWCTRVSRVNAEKRLKHKEAFAEGLNIYYSCFTVILSIFLFLIQNEEINRLFSAISLTMTVVVTICILYYKSLRYADRARDYKSNYTRLQLLEFSLKHITNIEKLKNMLIGLTQQSTRCIKPISKFQKSKRKILEYERIILVSQPHNNTQPFFLPALRHPYP